MLQSCSAVSLFFVYKQAVYEQLAQGCQIGKQLSRLKTILLSNYKKYRLKKSAVFPLQ